MYIMNIVLDMYMEAKCEVNLFVRHVGVLSAQCQS
jgi:hypothetical protein